MPETTTTAPSTTARPSTLAEFLERYPLPWRPYRIDSLSGAEWEIEAANGKLVPNHGGTFCLEEYARVFAELGNEVGRLRGMVRLARSRCCGADPCDECRPYEEALADTAAPGPLREGDPAPEGGANCAFRCDRWCDECARQENLRIADTAAPAAQQEGE